MGPYITTDPQLPAAIVSKPYTQAFTSVRGTSPVSYALSAASVAPPGLTLTPAGVLSGTPTATGAFSFTVVATDAAGLSERAILRTTGIPERDRTRGHHRLVESRRQRPGFGRSQNGVLQGGAGFTTGEVGQAFALDGIGRLR